MVTKIIWNEREWLEYRLNTRENPDNYPVIAWKANRDFGLMGDGMVSCFEKVPDDVLGLYGDDLQSLALWQSGFEAGLEKNID